VDQHTLRDLPQHGCKATVPGARQQRFAQRASRRCRSVCLAARQLITVTPFDAAPAEDGLVRRSDDFRLSLPSTTRNPGPRQTQEKKR